MALISIFFRSIGRAVIAVATLALLVGFMSGHARADGVAPEDLVRKLAAEMTAAVRKDPDLQDSQSRKVADYVEKMVVPRFDFERITQIAMGRNWNKANPGEQKEIVGQFSRLLTRTYSNAIASLRDLDVEIKGTRVLTVNADVVVRTQMVGRPQPVAIDYSLANGAGGWRVYDVSVEGISLVSAYRDEFTGLVSSSGIPGLINALRRKNGG